MKNVLASCLCAVVLALNFLPAQAAPARPNVILFHVDDMGWQDTSVPFAAQRTPFNAHFRTPNMERLAAQGATFTHAYAAPVCTPSRIAILTGQSPARHHAPN